MSKSPLSRFISLRKSELFSRLFVAKVFWSDGPVNFSNVAKGIHSGYEEKRGTESSRLDGNSHPNIVSCLVKSCGFSAGEAHSISKRVRFKTLENPYAVLAFLRDQGFTESQIGKLVRTRPNILKCNCTKTLLPKIEFFRSMWSSRADLANKLSANQVFFCVSLEKKLIPLFDFFKSVFGTDNRIASLPLWRTACFSKDYLNNLALNVSVLREIGVQDSSIKLLLAHMPLAAMPDNGAFKEAVGEVLEMGFVPSKSTFVLALRARSGKSAKSRWERHCEVYRNWGWSEDNIRAAYIAHPGCMLISKQKLNGMLDFLIKKMGWDIPKIAQYSVIFCYSLEKRIIRRGSVIHLLSSKGLKKDVSLGYAFLMPEKNFFGKFVNPYVGQVPQLHDVYQGKIQIPDFSIRDARRSKFQSNC